MLENKVGTSKKPSRRYWTLCFLQKKPLYCRQSSPRWREALGMALAPIASRSMFADGFTERHDLDQYVWTRRTVSRHLHALQFTHDCCCLVTPSLAQAMPEVDRDEILLDVDTRFNYLPKSRYWDLWHPKLVDAGDGRPFQVVFFDPPFFYIRMSQLYDAVLEVRNGGTMAKIMVGFLRREELLLLSGFADFGLRRTGFQLEYATVIPKKWTNCALYSNVDLPSIKRKKK